MLPVNGRDVYAAQVGKDVSRSEELDGAEASAPQVGFPRVDAESGFSRRVSVQRLDASKAETKTQEEASFFAAVSAAHVCGGSVICVFR